MKRNRSISKIRGTIIMSLLLIFASTLLRSSDFGTSGTGQDAISWAPPNPRQAFLNPNITLDPNIVIMGNDDLAAVCALGDGSAENPYVIENFIFNGSLGHGIELSGTNASVIIRNCTVMNGTAGYHGIDLWKCSNVNITNNTFAKMGYGISLRLSNLTALTENNCSSNVYGGIFLMASENNNVTKNYCFGNDRGIKLRFSDNNRVTENNCTSNGCGIDVSESEANELAYNNITYAGGFGIELDASSKNNILTANSLTACGFGTFGPMNDITTGNKVNGKSVRYFNQTAGIVLSGIADAGQVILIDCDDALVENLEIFYTSVGIFLMGCTNITLSENTCKSNRMSGIYGENITDSTVRSNDCSENGGSGVYLLKSCRNDIIDNLCDQNAARGIFLWQSDSNSVTENTCSDNGQHGIFLWTSNENTVSENLCKSNTIHGIYLLYANRNTITKNTCSFNGEKGIYCEFSEENARSGNIIHKFYGTYGIILIGMNIVALLVAGNRALKTTPR